MQLLTQTGPRVARNAQWNLVVYDPSRDFSNEEIATFGSSELTVCHAITATDAIVAVTTEEPTVLVIPAVEDPSGHDSRGDMDLLSVARSRGIPVLRVYDAVPSPQSLVDNSAEFDDWIVRDQAARELPGRAAVLLARRKPLPDLARRGSTAPASSRFFPLIVHDLRTPLNVIGLSLRMIEQEIPRGSPELEEDLRFVDENFKQIERMLTQLSDYCRLFEGPVNGKALEFSPERLLFDVIDEVGTRIGAALPPIQLSVESSCPSAVAIDQMRARQALYYALSNALTASNGSPVRVNLRGEHDRWVIEIAIDQPPPPSVKSHVLVPNQFERLCGSAAERRGMDLAIASWVSAIFGGTSRLEVIEGQRSSIILEWPIQTAVS